MKLHVLTAVSRPENLPAIAESLATAAQNAPSVEIAWHWGFDLERQHVGGQAVKNALLDRISDGWVWVLDDDTLAHEDVLRVFSMAGWLQNAVIVSQQRCDGRVLRASPDNICPGSVDIGQAFLLRSLIGDLRIPEHYNGDGMFLESVLSQEWATRVHYLDHVVSLHNALSGVEVSL